MDEMVLGRGGERAGDLQNDSQCDHGFNRPLSSDERLDGLAINKLHRVKKSVTACAEVKDGGYIRMPQLRRGPRFAHEALLRDFALEVFSVNHLERDRHPQVRVERLVRDSHRAAAQFVRRTVLARQHFIVIEGHFGAIDKERL